MAGGLAAALGLLTVAGGETWVRVAAHGRVYAEAADMEVYLLARGGPASQIVLDYAGFDTYDSCARAPRSPGSVRRGG